MSVLKNAAKELRYQLIDATGNKTIDLLESLSFKHIIRLLKENGKILVQNTNYWLDPQGKFHDVSIEGGHMAWAKDTKH